MVKINIIIAGVGGQGVVLAGDIIGEVALDAGLDVKKTDTLGMAQRGGSVVTHLKIGENVASPLIGEGQADILLAFEKIEAARWSGYLREGASVIVNDLAVPPVSVSLGSESYPDDGEIIHILKHHAADLMLIGGSRQAAEMGNPRILNIFMLGALSMLTPFNPELWADVISKRLPLKTKDINLEAFRQGRRGILAMLAAVPGENGYYPDMPDDGCGCHH